MWKIPPCALSPESRKRRERRWDIHRFYDRQRDPCDISSLPHLTGTMNLRLTRAFEISPWVDNVRAPSLGISLFRVQMTCDRNARINKRATVASRRHARDALAGKWIGNDARYVLCNIIEELASISWYALHTTPRYLLSWHILRRFASVLHPITISYRVLLSDSNIVLPANKSANKTFMWLKKEREREREKEKKAW